jgi:hypothetical protein
LLSSSSSNKEYHPLLNKQIDLNKTNIPNLLLINSLFNKNASGGNSNDSQPIPSNNINSFINNYSGFNNISPQQTSNYNNNSNMFLQQILSNCMKKGGSGTGTGTTSMPTNTQPPVQPGMQQYINNANPNAAQLNSLLNLMTMTGYPMGAYMGNTGSSAATTAPSNNIYSSLLGGANTSSSANTGDSSSNAQNMLNLFKLINFKNNLPNLMNMSGYNNANATNAGNSSSTNNNLINNTSGVNITNKMNNITNVNFFNNLFNITDPSNLVKNLTGTTTTNHSNMYEKKIFDPSYLFYI